MIELEFRGFALQPGSALRECLDAAGVDASVGKCDRNDADAEASACPGEIAVSNANGGAP